MVANTDIIIERTEELLYLKKFIAQKGSGFLFVRGRRRVGKSWLLKKMMQQSNKNPVFRFAGRLDERTKRASLQRFMQEWESFSHRSFLSRLRVALLDWKDIFSDITQYIQNISKPLIVVIDEIQWVANLQSGFVGALKDAWIDWEQSGKIKIIVCGSSMRFFSEMSGGEEQILRGMVTTGDLWVHPFDPKTLHKLWFKKWKPHEVLLCHMITGGVPYYLQQIDANTPFMQAINAAFFCANTIFFREVDELLRLDFNENGKRSAINLMQVLGENGATEAQIVERSSISRQTVQDALDKLERYLLIERVAPTTKKVKLKNNRDVHYVIADPFLDFYFKVLYIQRESILANKEKMLFSHIFFPTNSFYIPNFTGMAFERIVRKRILEYAYAPGEIHQKLKLYDPEFLVESMWTPMGENNKGSQIDIVVTGKRDRVVRVIECKWAQKQSFSHIEEAMQKQLVISPTQTRENYLCISYKPTSKFLERAYDSKVKIIEIKDILT